MKYCYSVGHIIPVGFLNNPIGFLKYPVGKLFLIWKLLFFYRILIFKGKYLTSGKIH